MLTSSKVQEQATQVFYSQSYLIKALSVVNSLVYLFQRNFKTMGFRFPGIVLVHAKKNQVSSKSLDVPKGYLAIYVGESQKKRFVIPVSYLNQPPFQDLLSLAEDEFGYDHLMGVLTIPCGEDTFLDLTTLFGV
ncbi:auxin-induced protein 15A-like [Pyrus ussuriensis x Pyrus communis]|uniref:Auxin-induced protein 15A-like n=1 Tax=Pyrus ussuriensis x Pyrus communis TaxID=2448454 RepID=A0A5N5IA52_9ROSA|nr:auxin-induced protein 15A-like [Pyrus ussuriensis x Pyrus communis]